jgi:crotonobetainyl-CoA:carnitine CoA-transferase CaiB-like acyl-CoA transferase
MGVERGGVELPEIAADPEAAAVYQAGADGMRLVAGHLSGQEFFVEAQRRGIPAATLCAPEEVLNDPHFAARGFPVEIFHEDVGRPFVYPGPMFHASRSPWVVGGRAPYLDEQGDALRAAAGKGA